MAWDPVWEDIFQSREWGKYPPERVIRFVAMNFYGVPDRSAIRLLDLGCGPGACTWYMAREGFSVSAIDGSVTGVERAGLRVQQEGLKADFKVGDFRELPWPDASFDGVIDNAALYSNSFSDCRRIVDEVRRTLKPGGLFLSCSFTPRTWGCSLGAQTEPGGYMNIEEGPLQGKGFSLFMSRTQLEELFSGFEEVKIDTESLTLDGGNHTIEMWVVTCRAPK